MKNVTVVSVKSERVTDREIVGDRGVTASARGMITLLCASGAMTRTGRRHWAAAAVSAVSVVLQRDVGRRGRGKVGRGEV